MKKYLQSIIVVLGLAVLAVVFSLIGGGKETQTAGPFQPETIMYVVSVDNQSMAFKLDDLIQAGAAIVNTGSQNVIAKMVGVEVEVYDGQGNLLPGRREEWSSWSKEHQRDGLAWKMPSQARE